MKKNTKKTTNTVKHVPQRTCIACRTVRPKRELVRLVLTSNGRALIDATGKASGRGGYLCLKEECWEAGLRGNRLKHALKANLTQDDIEQLFADMRRLSINKFEENAIGKSC